ncbi:hypothetical protein ETB97_002934 [Aspergillus alliaceus]|uniref:Urease accessory protein UreD n=1 Tax=Petromyces alliaceus TaxID=209559 RepID=A0A5N7C4M5_PETAA|nr:uncharacterized protein BDW43DRAFT_79667 [Aspergillus alliaceus]KAB8233828.1 hypothetical protein BDW43DRAFT_79667 [Aspergillus alliaceus]KAE8388647.1 hypothetical protein BDV23DRAFT_108645 [Aspergillus alliaceus]KAF5859374.1 hypothetical protein ETB97_002934 [Aspergillus burnettii]
MPHKHKRKQNDANIYDLPPSMIAKSLPTRDPNAKDKNKNSKKNAKVKAQDQLQARRKAAHDDDTPKAFLRLMQFQTKGKQVPAKPDAGGSKKRKRGLDKSDDVTSTTRKKSGPAAVKEQSNDAESQPKPKILPGEKLSDFAARVDREMPISGMKKSGKPASLDVPKIRGEHRVTKHEKHLLRLQKQWREEEAEILEREAAEREQREEELEDQLELWKEWETEAGKAKAKKKGAGARKGGKGNGDPDPWAKLKTKDRLNKPANPFETAEAPPQLTKPKEIFKVRSGAKVDVANVPNAVGSLRRREELAGERKNIVEEYRRLMAEKRK